ncbi:MAG: type II toxin-antitoxin system death-on-curing family toxin [Lewinella sp.]|nr:type II toxin-antitoxin system death-on-curing family toxin [Lewinella sp.]
MVFLQREDIILINKLTINRHGGQFIPPENLLNEDRLQYALEIVQQTIFGSILHQGLADIAAAYMFYLVTGHVFQDGNKRTGLEAALLFLRLNDASLAEPFQRISAADKYLPAQACAGDQVLYHLTMELAAGQITQDQLKAWFTANMPA